MYVSAQGRGVQIYLHMRVCCEQSLSSLFLFAGHTAPPVHNTGHPVSADPYRLGVSRPVKLHSYRHSGRTDGIDCCCYECHASGLVDTQMVKYDKSSGHVTIQLHVGLYCISVMSVMTHCARQFLLMMINRCFLTKWTVFLKHLLVQSCGIWTFLFVETTMPFRHHGWLLFMTLAIYNMFFLLNIITIVYLIICWFIR